LIPAWSRLGGKHSSRTELALEYIINAPLPHNRRTTNGRTADAMDAVVDGVADAAIGPDNFAVGEEREARKAWQHAARGSIQQC